MKMILQSKVVRGSSPRQGGEFRRFLVWSCVPAAAAAYACSARAPRPAGNMAAQHGRRVAAGCSVTVLLSETGGVDTISWRALHLDAHSPTESAGVIDLWLAVSPRYHRCETRVQQVTAFQFSHK